MNASWKSTIVYSKFALITNALFKDHFHILSVHSYDDDSNNFQ